MTPERWKQIKQILSDAFALPDASWSDHLDRVCGDDASLRGEVESFLTVSSDELDGFLGEPIVGRPSLPADAFASTTSTTPRPREDGVSGGDTAIHRLRVVDLAPYTRLRVKTGSSEYWLTVVTPFESELLVQGGTRFATATRAQLLGDGVVTVGKELRLKMGVRQVITSRVRSVEVMPGR